MLSRIKTILNIRGFSLDRLGYLKENLVDYCKNNIGENIEFVFENTQAMDAIHESFENLIANIKTRGKYTQIEVFSDFIKKAYRRREGGFPVFLRVDDNKLKLLFGFELFVNDIICKHRSAFYIVEQEDFLKFLGESFK